MRYIMFVKDTVFYFINYSIAHIVVQVIKLFGIRLKDNLWLFGGNGGHYYSDNSAILHQYVEMNYKEINAYWVINKSSPDINKVINKENILYKHSIKANVYAMLADVLVCSHSIRGDIMRAQPSKFRHAITVDLFHGITAFKDKETYPDNDLVIATSEEEKKIKLQWPNNNEDNVVITGFPRYDVLYPYKNKKEKSNQIFYMPTWRPWLQKKYVDPSKSDKEKFQKSEFFKEIHSFLTSEKLNMILKENNYIMNVFVHINMHQFLEKFDLENKNVKILPADTKVQEQLIVSDILITDYSSVAWDFLYLNKPIFFYTFDLDEYQEHVKSCIKMPEELFGPVAFDSDEMVANLEYYFTDDLQFGNSLIKEMRQRFIKFDDNNNCKRVVDKINKMF